MQDGFCLIFSSRYTKQILYGVQHMHRKAMVHLDLKPENILCLGGEKPGYEEIKLIDFGMTRVVVDGEEESAICGTPEFVAPEVSRQSCCGLWINVSIYS